MKGVRNRRLTRGIFALAVGICGLLAHPSRAASQPPADTGWNTYKNDHLGVELTFPTSWRVVSREPYEASVELGPATGEARLGWIDLGLFQPIRASWFSDFSAWMRDMKRRMIRAGGKILSEESLTVSGYPAVRLTTSTAIQTFIAVPGKPASQVFQVIYTLPRDGAPRREQDRIHDRLISSLKISARP